jgi:excisionase family DNA binding protein
MSTNEHGRLLAVPEVAVRTGLGISTVRKKIALGEIPAVRLGSKPGSSLRVDENELERWLYCDPEDDAA